MTPHEMIYYILYLQSLPLDSLVGPEDKPITVEQALTVIATHFEAISCT